MEGAISNLNDENMMLPGYGAFITLLKEAFKPADKTGKAMNKLQIIRQGNWPAEELVTEFRLLAGQANLGQTSPPIIFTWLDYFMMPWTHL